MRHGLWLLVLLLLAFLLGAALGVALTRRFETTGRILTPGEGDELRADVASLREELAESRAEVARLRAAPAGEPVRADPVPVAGAAPGEPAPPPQGTDPGIRVTARDDHGAPVQGARVHLSRYEGGGKSPLREGATDATGTVVFAGLPEGIVSVEITKGSETVAAMSRHTLLTLLREGGIQDVEFRFPSGIPVTGVVTHARGGAVADLFVRSHARDAFGLVFLLARTDAAGRYRIDLPPGEHQMLVQGRGIECVRQWRVEVPEGASEVRKDFVVGVLSLRVRVRHRETGAPIRAAECLLEGPWKGNEAEFKHMLSTDENGEISKEDRPAGRYSLTVRKPGFGMVLAEVEITDDGPPAEVEVTLAPLVDVTLEVVGPDGRPCAGPVVVGWSARGPQGLVGTGGGEYFCDEDGRTRMERAAGPGEWHLSVLARGVGRGSLEVTVSSSPEENRFRVQLAKE